MFGKLAGTRMQKLIIGCGYLGERIARAWRRAGDDVWALTRSPARAEQFRAAGVTPVLGDVTQPETLQALPRTQTVLYAVGLDRTAGKSQREVYVDGLDNVLRVLSADVQRFISISSTSVYGQASGEWIDESSETVPVRPNGRVCLDAEQVVWKHFPRDQATATHGANILRLAGIYGPGRLLSRIEVLRSGEPVSGNPDAWLNLIHVDDAVRSVLACEQHGTPGEIYLVCDSMPVRRADYYRELAGLVGAPEPRFGKAEESADGRVLNKRCSNHRIRDELRVELAFPTIHEGLKDAVADVAST